MASYLITCTVVSRTLDAPMSVLYWVLVRIGQRHLVSEMSTLHENNDI